MTEQPTRPIALTVIPENIPAELKALRIWSNMRYEWNGKKWGKVPYTPFTTSKASSTRPSSWRTFDEAYACLLERPDFFDGLFLCLSADDPYTGGDFDHTEDQSRIPQTYAERSVGGNGSRFIGRGTIPSACKKPDGELYTAKRFLSITGHRLEGFPSDIRPIQPELDKLYEELKGTERAIREGKPGSGDRGAHRAAHDEDEWKAARYESRVNINRLLAELRRRSFNNKTGKRDTQLAYLLNENYTGFHHKWPHVGIVRSDGSLDNSQIRAVMANSIKGRGFTFPQFVALMSYFYGKECLDKWGMKERVQEELATLWHISRTPRTGEHQVTITPVKRGRGSDHSDLLERAYQALEDHKVGVTAFITQQELAESLGINRRTAITLMQELTTAGRISYTAMRSNAGIVVSFTSTVINNKNDSADIPHTNGIEPHFTDSTISAPAPNNGTVINNPEPFRIDTPQTTEIDAPISADTPETDDPQAVINDTERESEVSAAECGEMATATANDARERNARYRGIYSNSVSLSVDTITPQKRLSLKDAVIDALDSLPRSQANEDTGEMRRWPITVKRVVEFIQYEHADQCWPVKAIGRCYTAIRQQRKNQKFDDLREMKRTVLEKKHAGLQKEIARYERKAATDPDPIMRPWWTGRANAKRGELALHAGEIDRRNKADRARIERDGYSEGEQAEMLELIEQVRIAKPARRLIPAPAPSEVGGTIERLKARIANAA